MEVVALRILLLGESGRLGSALARRIRHDTEWSMVAPSRIDCDLANPNQVSDLVRGISPDAVVNCAAVTDVDAAERSPNEAWRVNAAGVEQICAEVAAQGGHFVQLSTDYVFDGRRSLAYDEAAKTNPVNVYGLTKAAGEAAARLALPLHHTIIRTSWLYGGDPDDFAKRMINLLLRDEDVSATTDVAASPSLVGDVSERIVALLELLETGNPPVGTFHIANRGKASRFEIAEFLAVLLNSQSRVVPTVISSLGLPAKRPGNSSLVDLRSREIGLRPLRHWRQAMASHLATSLPPDQLGASHNRLP